LTKFFVKSGDRMPEKHEPHNFFDPNFDPTAFYEDPRPESGK